MKLDRHCGQGKYAVVNLRRVRELQSVQKWQVMTALQFLRELVGRRRPIERRDHQCSDRTL